MTTTRILGITLLYGLFAAVYLRIAYPAPPIPKAEHRWGAPRLLVSDSVLYGFVRELLAQSSSDPSPKGMMHADFYINGVLFEHNLLPQPGKYLLQYEVQKDGWTLSELCTRYHLLTAADTVFMRQQMKYSTGFGLEQRFMPSYQVIPADTAWALITKIGRLIEALEMLGKRYKTNGFTFLSCPLFARDGKTVVVEISEVCVGILCGSGQTWLL